MSSSRKPAATETSESPNGRALADDVVDALGEVKAVSTTVIDVTGKTPLTDFLVIASGNSERHLVTLRKAVLDRAAERRIKPLGVEGERSPDWILIDLGDCVVHLMRPATRAYYDLERFWSVGAGPEPAVT